jgi:phosphopantothenoylcysteine decarboxylase/phosphopantothenate--cysteine ligase
LLRHANGHVTLKNVEPKPQGGGRTVALCVTGSIAAYKAVEVARLLVKDGVKVLPVMTASAQRFIGPATLAGLCGENVASDMWEPYPGEVHVEIARRADVVAIVPATADVLARLAHGSAADLVVAVALCARGPVVAAPAMHPRMWEHPATVRNAGELAAQGRVTLVGPVSGEVASGDVGIGRMAEPEQIAAVLFALLAPRDLGGLRVVVTAGPTLEDFDPVRFIGNRSSGKMGFAVAERAAQRGAEVTLIAGPTVLSTPRGVRRVDVRSALALRSALWEAMGSDLSRADALVMAAAVADYRPSRVLAGKTKETGDRVTIELVRNPDIVAEVGAARSGKRPVLVGFAVETEVGEALAQSARRKLEQKRLDLIVANEAAAAFGRDESSVLFVSAGAAAAEQSPTLSKHALADALLDRVRALWHGAG